MIVTFTPNPSLDRTSTLAASLDPRGVNQAVSSAWFAGGRGVHIAGTVHGAGRPALAILPMSKDDPLEAALKRTGTPYRTVPVAHRARTNVSLIHDDVATLIREPGHPIDPETVTSMVSAVMASCPGASWLALCGSLPPGAPVDLYQRLTRLAQDVGVKVALQTTGPALQSALGHPDDAPDLLVLNTRQLGEATGTDLTGLDELAADEHPQAHVAAAVAQVTQVLPRGIPQVLVTLGACGALHASAEGIWHATAERIAVRYPVGRGAAAVAGYLMACNDGRPTPERLARAVAYGSARTRLEISRTPAPQDADDIATEVVRLGA